MCRRFKSKAYLGLPDFDQQLASQDFVAVLIQLPLLQGLGRAHGHIQGEGGPCEAGLGQHGVELTAGADGAGLGGPSHDADPLQPVQSGCTNARGRRLQRNCVVA